MSDFDEAHDKLRLGAAHPQLSDTAERRAVAFHEAGHTVAAWLTPGADPVRKVTIVPRGHALGQTEQLPGSEIRNLSASYLRARLAVMLAGRTAEELVFGDTTTGAQSDLVEATRMARQMVTSWGMGERGLVAFQSEEQQPFLGYEMAQEHRDYSEATAARIDHDVQRLLEEAHARVRVLLAGARDKLDALAQTLLREETGVIPRPLRSFRRMCERHEAHQFAIISRDDYSFETMWPGRWPSQEYSRSRG